MMPKIHAAKSESAEEEANDLPMWIRGCMKVKNCLIGDIILPNLLNNSDRSFDDINVEQYDDFVYECSILPHYGGTDYVFLYDTCIQKFLPIAKCFQNTHEGDIKWLPQQYRDTNRYCWITVSMFDRQQHAMFKWPMHQCEPQSDHKKSWPCVKRDVNRIGYKVLSIIDTFLLDVIDRKLMYQVS